jgi:ribonuclease BN (tRNA processing enzyme)
MEHRGSVGNDTWTVRAIEVPHTQPYLRSLAYRLDSGGHSFVYTGDFGPTAEMASFAKGADIFVAMCHYITGTELDEGMLRGCGSHKMVAGIARDAGVKMLVLSHITEQIDVPGVRERVVHEAAEIFGGAVILGEDLMRLSPGAASPAKLR